MAIIKLIIDFHQYIFYRRYTAKSALNVESRRIIYAAILVSSVIALELFVMQKLIELLLFKFDIAVNDKINSYSSIIIAIIGFIGQIIFSDDAQCLKILKKFNAENQRQRNKKTIIIVSYVVFLFLCLYFLRIYFDNNNVIK